MSSYRFEGITNFRDFAECSGGKIPPGRLFRCATPSEATPADVDHIVNTLKIKTIIDLRTTLEADADVGEKLLKSHYTVVPEANLWRINLTQNARRDDERMLFHVPVLPSNLSFLRELSYSSRAKVAYYGLFGYKDEAYKIVGDMMVKLKLQGLYRLILKTSWKNILRTLELLSDERNYPMMIHCTQGKDRTGMIASLLLHVCQVPETKISEDYAKSEKELEPMRMNSEYMKRNFARAESLGLDMTSWMLSPMEAIEQTHAWVRTQFGGYTKYLEWIRFNISCQARLYQVLVRSNVDREGNADVREAYVYNQSEVTLDEDTDPDKMLEFERLTPTEQREQTHGSDKEEKIEQKKEEPKHATEGTLIPDLPPPIPKRPPKKHSTVSTPTVSSPLV